MSKNIIYIGIDVDDNSFHITGIINDAGEILETKCKPTVKSLENKLSDYKAKFTSSLQLIMDLVQSGEALAFLPKFYVESMGLERIRIRGCKFNCEKQIYLSTSKHEKTGWISNAISSFKI